LLRRARSAHAKQMSTAKPCDYDKVFDEKRARSNAREYARNGLSGDQRRIVNLVRETMPPGYDVLELGGGVGEIQIELLKVGAARVLNVELATQYEAVAAELIQERGLGDSVERRLGDFVREAGSIPAADVVVMNRVVCCYPDADALVTAAADHARRLLVMTFPVDRWWIRLGLAVANTVLRIRGRTFRAYAHATRAVLSTAERRGMLMTEHRRGLVWQLIALER
ncbi:MAG: class I SAM-dependent methyltransferase, partial [Chloroflexota bacterium]|nr:class I SAM-dependent methyltransferase [Chloroflexota bacterium]